jgi:hypothetical protein
MFPQSEKPLTLRGRIALELARRGFRIFPLRPNDKTPALARWPELATTDSEQIEKWWRAKDYNIGIATGWPSQLRIVTANHESLTHHALIVVDYDMKPGQRGAEALAKHAFLELVNTLTAKTPHGIHKYFWAKPGMLIPRAAIGSQRRCQGQRVMVGPAA